MATTTMTVAVCEKPSVYLYIDSTLLMQLLAQFIYMRMIRGGGGGGGVSPLTLWYFCGFGNMVRRIWEDAAYIK